MKSELMLNLKRHECNTLNSNVFSFFAYCHLHIGGGRTVEKPTLHLPKS